MKIKPNIGIINALIRITLGFTFLAWATAKLTKRPRKNSTLLVAMMAGMKIAEGIVRYCPLTALLDRAGDNDHASHNVGNHKEQGTYKEQGMDAKSLMTEFAKMAEPTGALKSGPAPTGNQAKSKTTPAQGMDAKSLMTEFAKMAEPTGALKSGPAPTGNQAKSKT
ncbi:YgaP family membrane protein, partial [Neobacillus terrae]|uniref:YgaP family membrane protein n=1 Tax=Neobacillus terrae TaxID=3034837 RepID=UPI00140DFC34|nr:DUF2892 domain-containing protein [Neobacillus terrae]